MAAERTQDKSALARPDAAPSTPFSPFSMMRRLSTEMERMFDDVRGTRRLPALWRALGTVERWAPDIEMFERKGELVVRADLPGLSKDDVKVEVADGVLTVQGERKEEKEQKEKGYYACERSYGSFYRSVTLPEGVKGDDAKAVFKDGVLEVTMPAPNAPEKRGRQLEIKAS